MKVLNYLKLNEQLIILRFRQDRTHNFQEVYHAHQGMELLYIHEGTGRAMIDRRIYEIRPGSLVFLRPFQLHRIQIHTGPEAPYIRSLFVFEPHIVNNYLAPFPGLRELLQNLCYDKEMDQVVSLRDNEFCSLSLLAQKQIDSAAASERLEQMALFLISLLGLVKTEIQGSMRGTRASRQQTAVEQMIQWIDEHYMEPFELESLSRAVHLSPVYVSKLFSKSAGSSITEYLTARRVQQACRMLKTEERSVKEVGEAVGISNVSYFCQLFKKNTGISPHQYRKLFMEQPLSGKRSIRHEAGL